MSEELESKLIGIVDQRKVGSLAEIISSLTCPISILSTPFFIYHLQKLIKIYTAPKLFVLDYLKGWL